jgi:hypothetical protein
MFVILNDTLTISIGLATEGDHDKFLLPGEYEGDGLQTQNIIGSSFEGSRQQWYKISSEQLSPYGHNADNRHLAISCEE